MSNFLWAFLIKIGTFFHNELSPTNQKSCQKISGIKIAGMQTTYQT